MELLELEQCHPYLLICQHSKALEPGLISTSESIGFENVVNVGPGEFRAPLGKLTLLEPCHPGQFRFPIPTSQNVATHICIAFGNDYDTRRMIDSQNSKTNRKSHSLLLS